MLTTVSRMGIVGLLCIMGSTTWGQTWVGPSPGIGDWNTGANWSGLSVPTQTATATFNLTAAGYTAQNLTGTPVGRVWVGTSGSNTDSGRVEGDVISGDNTLETIQKHTVAGNFVVDGQLRRRAGTSGQLGAWHSLYNANETGTLTITGGIDNTTGAGGGSARVGTETRGSNTTLQTNLGSGIITTGGNAEVLNRIGSGAVDSAHAGTLVQGAIQSLTNNASVDSQVWDTGTNSTTRVEVQGQLLGQVDANVYTRSRGLDSTATTIVGDVTAIDNDVNINTLAETNKGAEAYTTTGSLSAAVLAGTGRINVNTITSTPDSLAHTTIRGDVRSTGTTSSEGILMWNTANAGATDATNTTEIAGNVESGWRIEARNRALGAGSTANLTIGGDVIATESLSLVLEASGTGGSTATTRVGGNVSAGATAWLSPETNAANATAITQVTGNVSANSLSMSAETTQIGATERIEIGGNATVNTATASLLSFSRALDATTYAGVGGNLTSITANSTAASRAWGQDSTATTYVGGDIIATGTRTATADSNVRDNTGGIALTTVDGNISGGEQSRALSGAHFEGASATTRVGGDIVAATRRSTASSSASALNSRAETAVTGNFTHASPVDNWSATIAANATGVSSTAITSIGGNVLSTTNNRLNLNPNASQRDANASITIGGNAHATDGSVWGVVQLSNANATDATGSLSVGGNVTSDTDRVYLSARAWTAGTTTDITVGGNVLAADRADIHALAWAADATATTHIKGNLTATTASNIVTESRGDNAISTLKIDGNFSPGATASLNLRARVNSGANAAAQVIVGGDVASGVASTGLDVTALVDSDAPSGNALVQLGGTVNHQTTNIGRGANFFADANSAGSTARVIVNGPVIGGLAGMVQEAGSTGNGLGTNTVEFNHPDNTILGARLDIRGPATVKLAGASTNNFPNIDAIRVLSPATLDVTGLDLGGLHLGRDQVQTLAVNTGATYDGSLRVAPGSSATFGSNFLMNSSETLVTEAGGTFTGPGITTHAGTTVGGVGPMLFNGVALGDGTYNWTTPGSVPNLVYSAGTVLAPGGSVGTTTSIGNESWVGPLTLQFEISDATGTAGIHPGWDLWDASLFDVDISALTSATIEIITSADGTTPGGEMANLGPPQRQTFEWDFLHYGTLTGAFDPSVWSFDTTMFDNLNNATTWGSFTVFNDVANSRLLLRYHEVPEPMTMVSFIALLALGLFGLQRRRTAAKG